MFLDIDKITEEEVVVDADLDLSSLTGDGGVQLKIHDVALQVTALKRVEDVELRGRLGATALLQCVRCLELFDHPISSEFRLTLVRKPVEFLPGETELEIEDTLLFHCPDGKADLEAMASEQLYLALPLKPICDPSCKGLCSTCGANQNRIECACCRDDLDPRLASLRALKDRMDKE
jgi:uncharacterized protein